MDAKLYDIPLANGETVQVRPLSPFMRAALLEAARQQHPDPDPEPYRRPLANALDPSLKEAPEENPEYLKALETAQRRQLFAVGEKTIRAGVVAGVKGETQTDTLARYAAQLEAARALVADLPADDWLACVMACLITSHGDIALIRDACNELLTQEDIERAAGFFRANVQRARRVGNSKKSVASGLPQSAR